MDHRAVRTDFEDIEPLRRSFLEENHFQIRYDACHRRGSADHYLLLYRGARIGYGATKGTEKGARDTVFEFFLAAPVRGRSAAAFSALVEAARPNWIECQSNDFSLFSMLCLFARGIAADTVLFEDRKQTALSCRDTVFRPRRAGEPVFDHRSEPVGDYVLDQAGRVVATGGFFTHYNAPFVDLYMEVDPAHRAKGLGSFLLQEIKAVCRRSNLIPAARCAIGNEASRATLGKAGMRVCGFMLKGRIGERAD